jgi:hypothetical protein
VGSGQPARLTHAHARHNRLAHQMRLAMRRDGSARRVDASRRRRLPSRRRREAHWQPPLPGFREAGSMARTPRADKDSACSRLAALLRTHILVEQKSVALLGNCNAQRSHCSDAASIYLSCTPALRSIALSKMRCARGCASALTPCTALMSALVAHSWWLENGADNSARAHATASIMAACL